MVELLGFQKDYDKVVAGKVELLSLQIREIDELAITSDYIQ